MKIYQTNYTHSKAEIEELRALLVKSYTKSLKLFNWRMRAHGIHYAYIASETKDPVVSHLHSSLGPVEMYQGFHWVKQMA